MAPDASAESLESSIVFSTSSPLVPVVEAAISAKPPLPLRPEPQAVIFGVVQGKEPLIKSVRLVKGHADASPPCSVVCDSPYITALLSEAEGDPVLEVTLSASAPRGALKEEILVCDARGNRLCAVPVFALFR